MKLETRKLEVLFLIGDDGEELATYCSLDGFHALVEELDPDLEHDMFRHMESGKKDKHYEMSE